MSTHMGHSLETKLQQFAEGLTPEEVEELRATRPGSIIEPPSPSLVAKAEQAVAALTPDELGHLDLLVQQAGADTDGAADVSGYRMRLDRLQPVPSGGGGAGGDSFLGQAALGLLGIVSIGLAGPNI